MRYRMGKKKRHDGRDGRDCYTVSVLDEKLTRADQHLQQVCDDKIKLEDELAKTITEILCIDQRVHELECKMEDMMTNQSASASQQRMKEELDGIKKDKEFMECEIQYYRKRLEEKMKKLECCRKQYYN